jgi:uncharacterized small protein (DUF1192 family)
MAELRAQLARLEKAMELIEKMADAKTTGEQVASLSAVIGIVGAEIAGLKAQLGAGR